MEPVSLEPLDLQKLSVRQLNHFLHHEIGATSPSRVEILNPNGLHNIAVGLDVPAQVDVRGPRRLFPGRHEPAGPDRGPRERGLERRRKHDVGRGAGQGIRLPVRRSLGPRGACFSSRGSASSRCGISLKGGDIVVGGHVGHMSAFMAQARPPGGLRRRRAPGWAIRSMKP